MTEAINMSREYCPKYTMTACLSAFKRTHYISYQTSIFTQIPDKFSPQLIHSSESKC
jgi:hypothetical protein